MANPNSGSGRHLAIATGGTGGHFHPALSIALEYQRCIGPVTMMIGGQHRLRHLEEAARHRIPAVPVVAVRTPKSMAGYPLFLLRLAKTVLHCRRLLKRREINCVLGMGSFASVPLGLAAATTGRPLYLHEGNAVIGRGNRLLQRRARLLMLSLPLRNPASARTATLHTGFPTRPELVAAALNRHSGQPPPPSFFREKCGLQPDLPTLLVFGGSQGAGFLNQLVARVCEASQDRKMTGSFQLLHFTGDDEQAREIREKCAETGLPAVIKGWCDTMGDAYQAADLVLCRAGGATLAETALFEKPVILVPLPGAMEDHQTANAQVLAHRQAAWHSPQSETTANQVLDSLASLLDNPDPWRKQGAALAALANAEAARRIVEAIEDDA